MMKISTVVSFALLGLAGATLGCAGSARASNSEGVTSTRTPVEVRQWRAWLNKMPPRPAALHVVGEVRIAADATKPRLTRVSPQGFNPKILLLELVIPDRPAGAPPTDSRWTEVRFDEAPSGVDYTEVEVRFRGESLQRLKVDVAY